MHDSFLKSVLEYATLNTFHLAITKNDNHIKYTVNDKNGKLVGKVDLIPIKEDNLIWIANLFVAKDYRHQGIGTQLVKLMITHGGNALTVKTDNQKAINLYKKNGFKVVARNGEYYIMFYKTAIPSKKFRAKINKLNNAVDLKGRFE